MMTDSPFRYALVALPVPVNAPFTYIIPDDMIENARFGHRTLVPFGRQMLTGFIIGVSDNPGDVPPEKLKRLAEIIDDEPVFDHHMLTLAEWVADYYLSSVGEVLRSATPFGTMIRSRLRIKIVLSPPESEKALTNRQREVLSRIDGVNGTLIKTLERSVGFPVASVLKSLEKKGLIVFEREITKPSTKPLTVRYVKPSRNDTDTLSSRAKEQLRCLETLKHAPDGLPLEELLERYGFSRGVVNALVKSGAAYYEEREVPRTSKILDQATMEVDQPMTAEQKTCFEIIMAESAASSPKPVLIHGVTGSGKTRVYIELVREMRARGKSALILVPEIALTPQTTRVFTSAFPGKVAVMHSAMSPGERFDMWRLIHAGERDVVIGPRSAVFAPLVRPGIIIIDEEHDTSYKQSDISPRYHARDTAVVKGRLLGIPVVMGTATPSLESWFNASTGKYLLATLTQRVHARPLPVVTIVDMRAEREAGNLSSLSRLLRTEVKKRIDGGEKSIILINRRGYASIVQCKSCGKALMCPRCESTLTYHSSKGLAVCHLCGHEQIVLEHCPHCGSTSIHFSGQGTQKIEKELIMIAGQNAVIRMDSDTTGVHDAHYRLLEEFRTGNASILLGTQMVAKGLDFPEVTLVGIISADATLYLPDFRAGERTFQLITQVAGRAGRGMTAGTVVLQSFNCDNYAVVSAARQDFETFVASELATRKEIVFPPFARLALITTSSPEKQAAEETAHDIAVYLTRYSTEETEIFGPTEAPIPRIRGNYRMHILVKSRKIQRALPLLRFTLGKFLKQGVTVSIDVDPVDIM